MRAQNLLGYKDAGFVSILAASELALQGFEAVMQGKQNHGLYPKTMNEDAPKSLQGLHIVLNGSLHENTILAIGYHYNSKNLFLL
jgi:hypothetical protein